MKTAPLVSIIIPAYNSEAYISSSIESAIKQTWENKEVIVVNDGSTDSTLTIARQYESSNVRVLSQKNQGASTARNNGLRAANGDYIQFLDADDFLREDKIETQLNLLTAQSQLAVCKTVHFFDGDKRPIADGDEFFQAYLDDPLRFLVKLYGGYDYQSGMIQPNAFLVPRGVIEKAGTWNENLSLDDDGEYFCRVILSSKEIVYTPEEMNFYRKSHSGTSLSGSKSDKAYRSQFKSIRLKHEHLLRANEHPDLIPYIHTATYKGIRLLMHSVYPEFKELYRELEVFSQTLQKHPSRGDEVYGGKVANFIGNKVSWKLLKRMQIIRSKFFNRTLIHFK